MLVRQLMVKKETYLAIFTLTLGLWCLNQTRGLEGDAWLFPFYLSLALTVLGTILMVQCLLDKSEQQLDRNNIAAMLRGPMPFAVISGLWAWALQAGFGYLLPSAVAAFAMLTVTLYSSPGKRLLHACLTAVVIFVMFYIVFGSPLPVLDSVENFFNAIDEMIRE